MKKDISVIVPVYNGENYIKEFIKNILSQSIFERLYFIIVNDGSKDNTYNLLKEYEVKYPLSIKVVSKENGGVSSARNKGLDLVETKYFAFLDIDDLSHPCLFERLYQLMEESKADMVCGGVQKITVEQAKTFQVNSLPQEEVIVKAFDSELAIRMLLQVPTQNAVYSKLYCSNSLRDIRFDERLAIAEDKLFVFQCMTQSQKVMLSSEPLYFYIQQPISAMSYTNARNKLGQDIVLDIIDKEVKNKYPNSYSLCAAIRAKIHAGAYVKVFVNDKDYKEKCRYYRSSVAGVPLSYILRQVHGISLLKVLLVKYVPIVFIGIRLKNRNKLI